MPKGTQATKDEAATRRTLEDVKRPLRAFVKAKGLHESKIRDLIVETFLSSQEHLGLDQLLERVRAKNPGVGMATVYRTMRLLEEAGLVQTRNFNSGPTLYEMVLGRPHHDHLICTRCGTIVEFENDRIEALQDKVARQHGFQVTSHKMELYGFCDACQREIAGGDSPRA
jgi:Fur family transcriptional regulator, ferric uptake regulator